MTPKKLREFVNCADPERRNAARRAVEDHTMTISNFFSSRHGIAGWVETKKVISHRRKPDEIYRREYHVSISDADRSCECKDWEYRGPGTTYPSNNQIAECKHMIALAAYACALEKNAAKTARRPDLSLKKTRPGWTSAA